MKLICRLLPNCFILGFYLNVWFAGGELFTGLYSDYWGRDAAVFRSMNRAAHLRTEPDNERLLKGVGARAAETRGAPDGWTISGLHGITDCYGNISLVLA